MRVQTFAYWGPNPTLGLVTAAEAAGAAIGPTNGGGGGPDNGGGGESGMASFAIKVCAA